MYNEEQKQNDAQSVEYYTRGYLNNNPTNIRMTRPQTKWEGQLLPNTDGAYEQFKSMPYGYRAAFRTLRTYIRDHGVKTVSDIINRWAPERDGNYVTNYINSVCQDTGFLPGTIIDYNNREQMQALVAGMSIFENDRKQIVPWDAIQAGWELYKS